MVCIPKLPTHVIRLIDNWDGEGDIKTALAYKDNGIFRFFDSGDYVIKHVGDKFLDIVKIEFSISSKLIANLENYKL